MDFFGAQDTAKRRTGLLVALFGAALLAITLVIFAVVRVSLAFNGIEGLPDLGLFAVVALGVGLLVGGGTAFRTSQLRQGGPAVAHMLGGRRVAPGTTDPAESRLVNVVEEMSIAAGTPVPAIFVIDEEPGINAFAAGYSIHDAAVAVTRGTLERLDRSELQGVIAHEFSHILNGDMRLNIRLIGLLYGILLLAVVGRGLIYARPRGGGRRGGGRGEIAMLGIALLLVGYIGVFFGRIIKASISRQREYLADAAAVQFTRDPDGIGGALKKIGGLHFGSRIRDHHAEELSHLFFANGMASPLVGLFATHPPLPKRIRRIDPHWDGRYPKLPAREPEAAPAGRPAAPGRDRHGAPLHPAAPPAPLAEPSPAHAAPVTPTARREPGPMPMPPLAVAPAAILAAVGSPTPEHVAHAGRLLAELPAELRDAAHDPSDARALVFALLLPAADDDATAHLETIDRFGGPGLADRVRALRLLVRQAGDHARLPLLDLSLPALKTLPRDDAASFRRAVHHLIRADGDVDVFEYALYHVLARQLAGPDASAAGAARVKHRRPATVRREIQVVLSAIAWTGAAEPDAARAAFTTGAHRLPPSLGRLRLLPAQAAGVDAVDDALARLETASFSIRKIVLEACAHTAAHDGRITTTEAELLRAIAESLDCPLPPLV